MIVESLRRTALGLLVTCCAPALALADATITIVNADGPGEGLNDPAAPAAEAGCNAGETLGACRLRVIETAAAQWERLIDSDVTIVVRAFMIPLDCGGESATLGSAAPDGAFAGFPNAPRPQTAYHIALANALAGTDQDPDTSDITARFNTDIDNGECLDDIDGWWYGTDPDVPPSANRAALLPVVFHEIAHGLGFSALYNTASGVALTGSDVPIWGHYLYDSETSKYWAEMTRAERNASKVNDPHLVWAGARTNKLTQKFLTPPPTLTIRAPAAIAGEYEVQTAAFGPNVGFFPASGAVVAVDDGVLGPVDEDNTVAGTASDGCEPAFVNAAEIRGRIALVDRGYCTFVIKVRNAQLAGAIGVIVANNVESDLPGMGGFDDAITIPSLGVTQATGASIRRQLPTPGVEARLGARTDLPLSGTQQGCIRMHAPTPLEAGSSVSHFTADAFPNLLMEPSLSSRIFDKVDLTLPLFRDIGWRTQTEDLLFFEDFDENPCPFVRP